MPDYRIYPSLLDKFQQLLDYEQEAEESWNIVSESAQKKGKYLDKEIGDYILSPDEMYVKIESELIDTINRCPRRPIEAADKGTAFNEVVDCIIEHRQSNNPDITIRKEVVDPTTTAIVASLNGFSFAFDANFCKSVARYFDGAIPQYMAKAEMETKYGEVELYGYIDELMPRRICDIKTTSRYEFGKFERKWQRHLYPYCMIESSEAERIDEFEYTVLVWNKTPLLTATMYKEVYTYNHQQSTDKLRAHVEYFIWWLNQRKDLITDKRIFGGENDIDYVGTPIDINILK